MDEVAFMCARRYTGRPTCVTVNIDNVTFRDPIRLGEHIVLTASMNHVGRSSMEIQVNVDREDPQTQELTHTNSAHLTFVCLDENFKPMQVPELILETEEDHIRNRESRLRMRIRRRLATFLAKRKGVVGISRSDTGEDMDARSEIERLKDAVLARLNKVTCKIGLSIRRDQLG
ncbi:MAG: acyl-CoA thioesterase [Calothrix sp. SM1_5_4]|nr:acyl-CoA thioesterase [Calothrix sp. SM1_5_4]